MSTLAPEAELRFSGDLIATDGRWLFLAASAALLSTYAFSKDGFELRYLISTCVGVGIWAALRALVSWCSPVQPEELRMGREYLDYPRPGSFLELLQARPARIQASDVEALEWDGTDNVGIRLRGGRVAAVPFLFVRSADRERAHAEILSFVSRATGSR